ncbi:penicillin-binding protein [Aquimarina sp. AD1]|uniref:transglycosylase domain-containing protein n=1 Tax=Aquimarina sp. (strain AD1) TaxID=1714848 RepID=UPI000E48CF3F|nr:transglycosylase domain-containing protein [Aquimarina sp. AD1]AXT57492.1 penicillin-binding protein [Aquimarina sp. AD1]RKN35754.1 penicillin-binding protein [Aquimarina sp. AD1]
MEKSYSKITTSKKISFSDKRRYIKYFWVSFIVAVITVPFLFLLASWGVLGEMPTFEDLENPRNDLASQIISSDGVQLGTIFKPNENRTPIKYDDLPKHLVDALIATEDVRFYEHSGVDPRGTFRAFASLGSKGGASTITQQLARLLFIGLRSKNIDKYTQKIREWVIAARLERQYTKNEIIVMYLNKYDFARQAIGIGSASRIYFNKELKNIKIEEAAVLIGMLKSATIYNPRTRLENAIDRRNIVLSQMAKYGYLTNKQKDSLQKLSIKLDYKPEGYAEGTATYFRREVKEFVEDWIKDNPIGENEDGKLEYHNIYQDGLKIYVTVNSRMQKYAEQAVKEHMTNLQKEFNKQEITNSTTPFRGISKEQKDDIVNRAIRNSTRRKVMKDNGKSEDEILASFDIETKMKVFSWKGVIDTIMTPRDSILYYKRFLHTGLMSMNPQTGEVKAWVGGINNKYFKYDHVDQGARQVGSTFKPFVYATAVDQLKYSPCYKVPRAKITIPVGKHGVSGQDWTPTNTDGNYIGSVTLKNGLAKSINTVSARLMDRIGPETVINLTRKLGIQSEINAVASIALGTENIKLSEMVGAYSAFANEGIYIKPFIVSHIKDKNGTLLYDNFPERKDVISKESAYITLNLMEGVTETGSGRSLRTDTSNQYLYKNVITGHPYKFENPIAGKTGTTQNNSDGWFMGIVPNLCTGVWVGGDSRSIHFESITYGSGASMALPIWALYMQKCYQDTSLQVSKSEFVKPINLSVQLDCEIYETRDKVQDEFQF